MYAACLMFELHKSNDDFFIEIFYKQNDDETPLEPLTIPSCGKRCSLSKFFEIYQDVIPTEDFDTECRLPIDLKTTRESSDKAPYHFKKLVIFNKVFYLY